jgi:hypothetical protein
MSRKFIVLAGLALLFSACGVSEPPDATHEGDVVQLTDARVSPRGDAFVVEQAAPSSMSLSAAKVYIDGSEMPVNDASSPAAAPQDAHPQLCRICVCDLVQRGGADPRVGPPVDANACVCFKC